MATQQLDPAPVNADRWAVQLGAVFGAITLCVLIILIFFAAWSPAGVVCRTSWAVALTFSLGASLSAGFLGGGAALHGRVPGFPSMVIAAGGGVAVLFLSLFVFSLFKPDCPGLIPEEAIQRIADARRDLRNIGGSADQARGYMVRAIGDESDRCPAIARDTRTVIDRVIADRKDAEDSLARASELLEHAKNQ